MINGDGADGEKLIGQSHTEALTGSLVGAARVRKIATDERAGRTYADAVLEDVTLRTQNSDKFPYALRLTFRAIHPVKGTEFSHSEQFSVPSDEPSNFVERTMRHILIYTGTELAKGEVLTATTEDEANDIFAKVQAGIGRVVPIRLYEDDEGRLRARIQDPPRQRG